MERQNRKILIRFFKYQNHIPTRVSIDGTQLCDIGSFFQFNFDFMSMLETLQLLVSTCRIVVYRSSPIFESLEPTFDVGEIDLETFCSGDLVSHSYCHYCPAMGICCSLKYPVI